MSISRHHAEWLSLIDASGPFLSMQTLLNAFPQGLEGHNSDNFRLLKTAYQEWQDNNYDHAIHRAWVEWILTETLEFPQEILLAGQEIPVSLSLKINEYQEIVRPDYILVEPDQQKPRLLIQIYPPQQHLEKPVKGSHWITSPATRMMELLRSTGVWLGLITNGEHWMLINAPRGGVELFPGIKYENLSPTISYISWYANFWIEEKITLRSFHSLLGVRRFLKVENNETLEALFLQSADSQEEVTNQLGYQVRKAVEVLIQKIDKIDQDKNRELLKNISDTELYEAALFVMMRLVFLFCAEEKELLLLGNPIYDQYYAVSTLRAELRETADKYGEEILERRGDAWYRLLATFRAVYAGIYHDLLSLPAYSGDLFNPDKFPFLEGRNLEGRNLEGRNLEYRNLEYRNLEDRNLEGTKSENWREINTKPLSIDNRTILHLLEALQILQVKVPGGSIEPRRLSFRALDVEQIGHVYEGLLDHTVIRANTPVLGLFGTKDKEPEVSLEELEKYREKGEEELVKYLQQLTGKSTNFLRKIVNNNLCPKPGTNLKPEKIDKYAENKALIACNNDYQLWQRIKPFYPLIRKDTFEYPLIIPADSVYVTQGSNRRETGTHYTPKSLTEEVVKYTLEPLVYQGVKEGKTQAEWRLKSAAELLNLKICDMAMGSGAFLVQVCRYLGEKLVAAWELAEAANPGKVVIAPEGKLSKYRLAECLIPEAADERLIVAKRIVAERCIYGVDKNPLAVEMAKLSLWLETLQKDKPFTFLNHALKCGDSLIGVTLKQLRCWNLEVSGNIQLPIGINIIRQQMKEVIELRLKIENKLGNTPADQAEKAYLLAQANARIKDLKDCADLLVGSYLAEIPNKEKEFLRRELLLVAEGKENVSEKNRDLLPNLEELCPFHWQLEFPEVFLTGEKGFDVDEKSFDVIDEKGFDALVGNPPFMGGQKITGTLGTVYRDYLLQWLAKGKKGSADLCAYFFLRGQQLIKDNGGFGLVATNTIAQGDTREVGLDQLVENGGIIYRAVSSRPWPGTASLEVAYIWLGQGEWRGEFILDDKPVAGITSYLTVPGKLVGNPYRLVANQNKSFQGSIVLGMGFILTPEEAQALIAKNPRNQDVLFPYLNGEDLNTNPDQSPSRWVINFRDWPLDAEHDDVKKPKGRPYAVDYPDCLQIVEEKVKPEREKNNRKVRRERWWQYGEIATGLYETIAGCDRVLVRARVSNTNSIAFIPTNLVMSEMIVVFNFQNYATFAILQSMAHTEWLTYHSSTLGVGTRYTPSDCFETFPFPSTINNYSPTQNPKNHPNNLKNNIETQLEQIGEKYYTHRQNIMATRQEGLTKTYNRFHDKQETATDIQTLRELHQEMDKIVLAAYGWTDIDLNHNFYQTKQGLRYTINEAARREILDRLLQLNHQRYAEEVKQGLHEKGKKKGKSSGKKSVKIEDDNGQFRLF